MATNIKMKKTAAGTGQCGSTTIATSLVCYLKAADGVYTVTADGSEVSLPQLIAFVNEFTSTVGTS